MLVLALTAGDATLSRSILTEAGLSCRVCGDMPGLCREFEAGAGAILLTEDGLAVGGAPCLAETLGRQATWSDVPVLLLCGSGADSPVAAWAMETLGNVTVLERPVRVTTLVSGLRTALKARRRQYELRDRLEALRRSEESLREANRLTRTITDNATTAVFLTDEAGRCTFMNPAAEAMTGFAFPEAEGRSLHDLVHHRRPDGTPYPAADCPLHREGALSGNVRGHEDVFVHKDGRFYPVRCNTRSLFRDGRPAGKVVEVWDVTAEKEAEERLQTQNERLRLLWAAAAVLLSTEDPDAMLRGLFARISPHLGVDAYFNYMVDENGDGLRLASCIGIPDETARAIERLEFGQAICGTAALERRPIVAARIQQSDDPKARLVRSLGLQAYACHVLMTDGRLIGTLSFASRTRDEFDPDELAFLETVTHYVTLAYERLRLIKELREADARKNVFLATLAHELRNPLAPIRMGLEVLRISRDDPEATEEMLATMEGQVRHMVRLIDDLLDVSRITRGKLELKKARVELKDVVKNAVEAVRPLCAEAGHDLTVSLPPDPLPLDGDPARLSQVFGNLLTNACKYTPDGGRIALEAERQGSDVVVAVRDTGIGIPPEMLSAVFEMFTQVDRTLERSQSGLGIGLHLVKRLVELHGGTVEARSGGPGAGSEFVVRLPLVVSPAAAEADEPAGPPNPAGRPRRVLVADDNQDAANSLSTVLRVMGHEVRTAYDGEQA
ncbi:MAG TPA: ATP-binding protein, partial [Planctomycetaceae bacterium]